MSIEPGDIERFANHPFVLEYSTGTPVKKHLTNTYFDTPDYSLWMHGMALRIRFDGENYIQTLKKGGECRDGLSVRGEWEWRVGGYQVDLKRLPHDICPPAIYHRLDELAPVFQTDFERTVWDFRINAGELFAAQPPAMVEMALDNGNVVAHTDKGTVQETILEIELELLEGEAEILFRISNLLGKERHLTASNVSKARRGYRLLGCR